MKIDVIATGSRQGWTVTPIKVRDLFDFHETMADWPEDHIGKFTLQRSTAVINKHVERNKVCRIPITKTTRFNRVWVVRDGAGEWIGYWREKVKGKHVHLAQTAIHPDHRGQGYFQTFMHLQVFVAFYVYKGDLWSFEIANKQQQLQTKIDRHMIDGGNGNITGERDSQSVRDAHVVMYERTRAEQQVLYGTVQYQKDIDVGLVVNRGNIGYKGIFKFTK